MRKGEIKAVIFDLDGTLIRLPIDYRRLFEEFKRILRREDVQSIVEAVMEAGERERRELLRVWTKAELEALPNIEIIKDGIQLYHKFSDKRLALVTLQSREAAEKILESINLNFDFILTREDNLSRKEQIIVALKRFRVPPKYALFIGDHERDRRAAEEVGCNFIMVEGKNR